MTLVTISHTLDKIDKVQRRYPTPGPQDEAEIEDRVGLVDESVAWCVVYFYHRLSRLV